MNNEGNSKREARELWSQMLLRAKENEYSTFDDPNYEHPEWGGEKIRQALSDAGWSDEEIDLREKTLSDRTKNAPVTSPGVARHTELSLQRLSQPIEKAAIKLNISNRNKVHFAVEPKAGPFVSKINVVMTDQSIITMGSFFPRYCGLVSRAYVRTITLAPWSVGSDFNEELVRRQLRERPDILIYWWRIFVSFALTGSHVLCPYKPSTKSEILLVEQVAHSMEFFGLAHEYAHHALNHGRAVIDQEGAHSEEFEADAFALRICELIEEDLRYTWLNTQECFNPYLWSGAGGILLLSSLEAFRKVKDRIFSKRVYDTHPDFLSRSFKIKNRYVVQPEAYRVCQDFCSAVENVLKCVMLELEPMMLQFVPEKFEALIPDDWEVKSFE